MKLLHILRSEPDELVRQFIDGMASQAEVSKEVPLEGRPVDYDRLVEDIFAHDKVICWW